MGEIFLKLLNLSITASWLILAVLGIRLLFRKIPKWITCLLWGVVAIRLIFPFSIESGFSLQPSAEPIRTSTMVEGELIPYVPFVDSNIGVVENTVNPLLAEAFAYQETESVAPLQIATGIAGSVWLCGMVVLLIFALVSMIKLRLRVREAVRYKENIYICDAVKSPFILGIIKPRIYLSSAIMRRKWISFLHMKGRIYEEKIICGSLLDTCFCVSIGSIRCAGLPILCCARILNWLVMKK